MILLKLTQNEVCRLNVEYPDLFWLPLKRLKNKMQVIVVEDGADLTALTTEPYTYINADGLEVEYDMTNELKKAKEVYLQNNTITTASGKEFDANLEARVNMLSAIDGATLAGLTQTVWRLADNTQVAVTLDELKEASLLAVQRYAEVKGIA